MLADQAGACPGCGAGAEFWSDADAQGRRLCLYCGAVALDAEQKQPEADPFPLTAKGRAKRRLAKRAAAEDRRRMTKHEGRERHGGGII